VEVFSSPVKAFESRVGEVRLDIVELKEKLEDLKNNSDKAVSMVSFNYSFYSLIHLIKVLSFYFKNI